MSSFIIRRTFMTSPPIRNPFFSLFNVPVYKKSGLTKNCAKNFLSTSWNYTSVFALMSNMRRTIGQNLNISDDDAEVGAVSGYLKDDLHTFWSLARKFELPIVFLVMVVLGWRHPITLVINIALLLLCTKPSSPSIFLFIEELRKREMRQNPSPYRTKLLYVKNVEVVDYQILCLARVVLRDAKLDVIGILGGWWVVQSSTV